MADSTGGLGGSFGNIDSTEWATLGLGGLAGLFPNTGTQSGTTSSTSNTNTTSNLQSLINQLTSSNTTQAGTSSTQATVSPAAQTYIDKIMGQYSSLLNKNTDMSGYQANQTENINKASAATGQAQQEALAAKGLSTSPVSGSIAAQNEASRTGNITSLQQQIPLLQQQLQLSALNQAGSFVSQLPKGSTTTSSGTSGTTGSTSGTQTSTGTGSTSSTGTSTNTGSTSSGGGLGGLFSGIGGVLAGLL